MIEWKCVATGADGLRIYRVDAESGNVSMGGGSGRSGPLDLVFQQFPTETTRYLGKGGTRQVMGLDELPEASVA